MMNGRNNDQINIYYGDDKIKTKWKDDSDDGDVEEDEEGGGGEDVVSTAEMVSWRSAIESHRN